MYTEMSSFQGVGIEYIEVSSFQCFGIEVVTRCIVKGQYCVLRYTIIFMNTLILPKTSHHGVKSCRVETNQHKLLVIPCT